MSHHHVVYIKKENINEHDYDFLLLLLFYIESSTFLKSDKEVLLSYKKNKYSILYFFDDSFRLSDNTFHFLMEYPEGSCSYFWSQTKNPLTTPNDEDVSMINLNLSCEGSIEFSGLSLSDSPSYTFLDGMPSNKDNKDSWHFPIGQKGQTQNQDRIPVYSYSSNPIITEVNLWVQIEDFSLLSRFKTYFSCKSKLFFHNIPILITIFMFS